MRLCLLIVLLLIVVTAAHSADTTGMALIPAGMALIPEGQFTMGGPGKDRDEDAAERPEHKLTLPAFYLDVYEVTTTQYAAFLNAVNCTQDETGHSFFGLPRYMVVEKVDGQWRPLKGKEKFPMTNVTWYGANAYAQWAGKRLPTEAEWEKTARGTDARKFVWGADFDQSKMRFGQDNIGPVGERPTGISQYGCHDMAGNVWEWTSSVFKPYPYVATDGREDPASTDRRVARGGSFTGEPFIATTTYRFRPYPQEAYYYLGFRCAK